MDHISHIQKNKTHLTERARIVGAIRSFFTDEQFVELEPPTILALPGQEPYLSPMPIALRDEQNNEYTGYLHTSPEYAMKKALAAGFEHIYAMGKCFRDGESFGGTHNPEFTMLEWYRAGADMWQLMDDCDALLARLGYDGTVQRIHMRELWQQSINVDLDEYLSREALLTLCVERGHNADADEPYEDLFFRIFLNEIEPKLADMGAVIIHHFPAQMAALSKLSKNDARYAERFELYINGIEIANAFSELTDRDEQERRLQEEQTKRNALGKTVYPIDPEFLDAVEHMPESAGIALGVDRLVQALLGCQNIDDVLVLPASKLFSK